MSLDQQSNLFQLPPDHHKHVLFFELNDAIDEENLVKYLKSNELIASFYIVNEKKNLIVVSKDKTKNKQIEDYIKENSSFIKCSESISLPHSNFNSVLVAEVTDFQLKRLSKDKSVALKMIESQTGLKLKKQKKTFYFNGLLYQFNLLNELFSKYPATEEETYEYSKPSQVSNASAFDDDSSTSNSTDLQGSVVLVGLKEDINTFYDINSNHVTVKNANNKTTWHVEFNRNVDNKMPSQQSTNKQNNNFGPAFSVTLNSGADKRIIKGEPLIKQNDRATDLFCILCTNEKSDEMIKCSNQKCTTCYCIKCLTKLVDNKKSKKCPNCPFYFQIDAIYKSTSKGFFRGSLRHKIENNPLEGYFGSQTIEFQYYCENGVQTNNDPEPGVEYRGTEKYWYVPATKEGRDLIGLFQKTHQNGLLFHLEVSRKSNKYQIFINNNIILKTDPDNGGRFGYPDPNYVKEITRTLKELLNEA